MSPADIVASVLLIAGAALSLIAGIAVLRFPDTATRIHAATKPQVLGIVLLAGGLGVRLGDAEVIGILVLIVVLQLLTVPVAAHLAVREAHRQSRVGQGSGAATGEGAERGDLPGGDARHADRADSQTSKPEGQ